MKTRSTPIALALALLAPVLGTGAVAHADTPAAATATRSGNTQPLADDAQRVMALQGAWNVRSFAGLQGSRGPIPANAFIRTADLGRLTAADRDALAAAGVTLDIDLRLSLIHI